MKVSEIKANRVYAGTEGFYDPVHAVPWVVVDRHPMVMEFSLPRRFLRRPHLGEIRNGEQEQEYPSAFRGIWVIEGTHDLYRRNAMPWLARQAREIIGDGAYVPILGEGVLSRVVLPRQIHMPWEQHLGGGLMAS